MEKAHFLKDSLCLCSQGVCAYAHKVLVPMLTRCLCLCSQGVCVGSRIGFTTAVRVGDR
jgi:hypothetical protein